MSRFCTSCGTAVADTINLCPQCGSPISAPTQQPPSGGSVYYMVRPSRQPRPGRGFGISSMVMGIVSVVCAVFHGALAVEFAINYIDFIQFATGYAGSIGGMVSAISYTLNFSYIYSIVAALALFAITSTLSIIFAALSRKRGYRCGISTSGLALGWIGLILCLLSVVLIVLIFIMSDTILK